MGSYKSQEAELTACRQLLEDQAKEFAAKELATVKEGLMFMSQQKSIQQLSSSVRTEHITTTNTTNTTTNHVEIREHWNLVNEAIDKDGSSGQDLKALQAALVEMSKSMVLSMESEIRLLKDSLSVSESDGCKAREALSRSNFSSL